MKIYPAGSDDGRCIAFEIDKVYIGPRRLAALLGGVAGVTAVRRRRPFGGSREVHIEFRYLGLRYLVVEPYGDNSRFWIGPEEADADAAKDAKPLVLVLENYRPTWPVRLVGDILTLDFKSLFRRS